MDNIMQRISRLQQVQDDEHSALLRLYATAPREHRLQISQAHQQYYGAPYTLAAEVSHETIDWLRDYKHNNPADYNYISLLLALEDYRERIMREDGKSSAFATAVAEARRRRHIARSRRQTTLDRIRALYPEIRILVEDEGLHWPEVLLYLRRRHRKMLGKSKLSASWLRRCYYKIKDDVEPKKTSPV